MSLNYIKACAEFIDRHCGAKHVSQSYRDGCMRLWRQKYGESAALQIRKQCEHDWKTKKRPGAPFSPAAFQN
jgi:hypothetical protein